MQVLVDITDQSWITNQAFLNTLAGKIPEHKIQFYPDLGDSENIQMIVCDSLRPGLTRQCPNVKLIQKLGAGVETIVNDPDIPDDIRITRLKPDVVAMEMARFCLAYVLGDIHNIEFHRQQQQQGQWKQIEPKMPVDISIGVLGLGHIGGTTAKLFLSMGFSVLGWSRNQKQLDGIGCYWGIENMNQVIKKSDFVVCVLPSTSETTNLFDIKRFKAMKPGSTLINVGRGTLIVEQDLIEALDQGCLDHAVLDVFQSEPLEENHPFWRHPQVTITPHVSGWHLEGFDVVAENFHALENGLPLIHEVDRQLGY